MTAAPVARGFPREDQEWKSKVIGKVLAIDVMYSLAHPRMSREDYSLIFIGKSEPTKSLLVLSIDLLRRSVAIEVDCTLVAPA